MPVAGSPGQAGEPGQKLLGRDAERAAPGAAGVGDVGREVFDRAEPAAAAGHQPLVLALGQGAVIVALLVGHRCERVALCPGRTVSQLDGTVEKPSQARSMRMSTVSGRFSKAARSEVISPILVRVGTEEVGA